MSSTTSAPPRPERRVALPRQPLLLAAAYVAGYVALDSVSYVHPFGPLGITPWNPPPGLTLFLLLRFGPRYTPAVYVAALAAELLVRGSQQALWVGLAGALLIATWYSAVGWVMVRTAALTRSVPGPAAANRLVAVALLGPLPLALLYAGLHVLGGTLQVDDLGPAAIQFWVGDAIGILVTTPLLLEYVERPPRLPGRGRPELVLQGAAVVAALWVVFGVRATDEFKFFYLLFLPPLWIALRHGIRGATVASLAIQLGVIAAGDRLVAKGYAVWELQFLMLTLALTMLYLGAVVTERAHAYRAVAARDAALHRALRIASAGELAAAIAHEVNQPLSAIGTYARAAIAMVQRTDNGTRLEEVLERIAREVTRAGEVVQRLREFYRTGSTQRETIAPATLVHGAVDALQPRLGGVDVEIAITPGLPAITVDRVQMQAVLHNLLGNAVDALAGHRAPRIRIGARAGPGRAVVFSVADNGPGIARADVEHLFAALGTTKPGGMGLGLAISRSIAEAHGGRIVLVESPVGGAAFEVTVPAARGEGDDDG